MRKLAKNDITAGFVSAIISFQMNVKTNWKEQSLKLRLPYLLE